METRVTSERYAASMRAAPPDLYGDPEVLRAWQLRSMRPRRVAGSLVAAFAVTGWTIWRDGAWTALALGMLAIVLLSETVVVSVMNMSPERLRLFVRMTHPWIFWPPR